MGYNEQQIVKLLESILQTSKDQYQDIDPRLLKEVAERLAACTSKRRRRKKVETCSMRDSLEQPQERVVGCSSGDCPVL